MEKVASYIQPSKILPAWSTGECVVPLAWMKAFRYFVEMHRKIKNVPGDIVECGTGEGTSLQMLMYLSGSENPVSPRMVWAFDSFEGWPRPTEFDASPRNPQKGEWAATEEMVLERITKSGIFKEYPNLQLNIKKGFFSKTLPYFPKRKIAFLHIDADLYPGYYDALTHLFPKVAKGGIVLFDEYKEFPNHLDYGNGTIEKWPGCTKAVDEYFSGIPYKIQYWRETKKYYVIKQ